jgi:hypothetical protein
MAICTHPNINISTYQIQYYQGFSVKVVEECQICKKILNETVKSVR